MTSLERILVIDDEQPFIDTYTDLLRADGYNVESARTPDEARKKLAEPGWALVLLDQKLQGASGADSGLEMIETITSTAPEARIIVATAYASNATIARAFRAGVYDYLEKNERFEAFLRAKVRNVMELARARTHAALDRAQREKKIKDRWAEVQTESDGNRKGRLLEELMALLFKSIPGFEITQVNRQNELEEIDVLVQNNATDPFWQHEGQYILAECKHWSKPVGVPELSLFWVKVERRYRRCRLGVFVAIGGFASTVKIEQWTRRDGDTLVLLLNGDDLRALVTADDRGAWLKSRHARDVIAGDNGKG